MGFERTRHSARRTGIGKHLWKPGGAALLAPWLALGEHTRLAGCHHKSSCASTTPRTVCKPQRKPKIPWRARCFSGTRWSGCGTGLQHPSNRSSVPFVDVRQHLDRAWYIEPSTSPRLRRSPAQRQGLTALTSPDNGGRPDELVCGRRLSEASVVHFILCCMNRRGDPLD